MIIGRVHQQWMLEMMLDIGPADPDERPQATRTQADKWAANLAAARQFHAREGISSPRASTSKW